MFPSRLHKASYTTGDMTYTAKKAILIKKAQLSVTVDPVELDVKEAADYTFKPEDLKLTGALNTDIAQLQGIFEANVDANGTEVLLYATPSEGYQFKGWKAGNDILATTTTYTHLLNEDIAIKAVFEKDVTAINAEIKEPVATQALPSSVTCKTDGVEVSKVQWTKAGQPVTGNAEYQTTYSVEITFKAMEGNRFTDDLAITLNQKAVTLKKNSDETITVSVSFVTKAKPTTQAKPDTVNIVKGRSYTVKDLKYKVTNANTSGSGTVTLTGTTKSKSKLTSLSIGSTVQIYGKTFKITAIGSNAFKGYTKLKQLTIGKNVKTIGKYAFAGDKKLKSITIKTTKLTSKTVGKKAFSGIYAKATIKVPKSKLNAYKKLLKSKGVSSKAKIKK